MNGAPRRRLLSVVVPLLNEAENLEAVHARLAEVAGMLTCDMEMVFVDDGSTDGSFAKLGELRVRALPHHGVQLDAGRRREGHEGTAAEGDISRVVGERHARQALAARRFGEERFERAACVHGPGEWRARELQVQGHRGEAAFGREARADRDTQCHVGKHRHRAEARLAIGFGEVRPGRHVHPALACGRGVEGEVREVAGEVQAGTAIACEARHHALANGGIQGRVLVYAHRSPHLFHIIADAFRDPRAGATIAA